MRRPSAASLGAVVSRKQRGAVPWRDPGAGHGTEGLARRGTAEEVAPAPGDPEAFQGLGVGSTGRA